MIQAIKETLKDYGGGLFALLRAALELLAVLVMFGALWVLLWLAFDAGLPM